MKRETILKIGVIVFFILLSFIGGYIIGKAQENKEIVKWYSSQGDDNRFSDAKDIIKSYMHERWVDANLINFYENKLVDINDQNIGIIVSHINQSDGKIRYYNMFYDKVFEIANDNLNP